MTAPVYTQGFDVVVDVVVPANSGTVITPSTVTYVVEDETGAIISGPTTIVFVSGTTDFNLTIPSTVNSLAAGVPTSLRQVVTTFIAASGTYVVKEIYILKNDEPLIVMTNSFVSWPETNLVRYGMNNLTALDGAGDDDKLAALTSAYRNMLLLRYRYPVGIHTQSRIFDFAGMAFDDVYGRIYGIITDMNFITLTDFNGFPANFQQALKRAQLAEANSILLGDPVGLKRLQGIESETVGESSMTFRRVPDISMAVSKDCLIHLRGFLDNRILLTRI